MVEDYLAKAPRDLHPDIRQRLRTAVRLVRERGYSIVAVGQAIAELAKFGSVQREQRDSDYWARVHDVIRQLTLDEIQLVNLADAKGRGVGYITAPIFSPTGEVAMELAIAGMPRTLSYEEIERYAACLRAATAVVMSETQGRIPSSRNYFFDFGNIGGPQRNKWCRGRNRIGLLKYYFTGKYFPVNLSDTLKSTPTIEFIRGSMPLCDGLCST